MISKNTAQQIVDTVKDVCGYDINYISTEGIIIASTSPERIGDFHEIGRKAAVSKETLEVYDNNAFEGAQKGVNIPFTHHGQVIAVIGITGEPEEVRRYARLALRIMRMLLRERDMDASRELRRAEFSYIARALTQNEPVSFEYLQSFLVQKNLDYHEDCRAVIIHMQISDRSRNVTAYENRFETFLSGIPKSFYAFDYPDKYILIVSQESYERCRDSLKEMTAVPSRIAAGSVQTLNHIHRSYDDALLALHASDEPFNEFDSLDIELLFSQLPNYAKERFLQKTAGGLSDDDIRLLRIYYRNNMSLKAASDELFIHKNTLQYRLDRIGRTCGLDPRNINDAAILIVAIKLKASIPPKK